MSTRTPAKKATATPAEKKSRGPADPADTHVAYQLEHDLSDDGGKPVLVDVVPFGHRAADEVTAMRWAMGRGYLVITVPAGTSVLDALRAEGRL